MIQIEKARSYGLESAIRGMRNPMNSWEKSDSYYDPHGNCVLGENDLALMKNLVKSGTDHRKFMRMITVYADITAPLYWWKEFDTYKVGTVANSCSTMHKIHDKEFTLDDFSWNYLIMNESIPPKDWDIGHKCWTSHEIFSLTIHALNFYRKRYLDTKNKNYWWQMIQLLPSSYNQKRTVMMNYEVLHNMYHARRTHKLDEWRKLCEWIETLPYAKDLICGE